MNTVGTSYSQEGFEKISIRAILKNPERLKFVHDHPKTKKMSKNAVTKFHVPDRYKTQEMWD